MFTNLIINKFSKNKASKNKVSKNIFSKNKVLNKLLVRIPAFVLIEMLILTALFPGCSSSKLKSAGEGEKNGANENITETLQSTGQGTVGKPQSTDASGNSTGFPSTGASETNSPGYPGNSSQQAGGHSDESPIDYAKIQPNEAGKIMVVMFHNFVEKYKSGDKLYTTTFDDFRKLLQTLYDMDYRLISLTDFLDNNIDIPAGCIPIVFTFDDGTAGQFNLIDNNGTLEVNKNSAVGIMEEFYAVHPDFGLEGTFYINMGSKVFPGAGTLAERLKYLTDRGFELGNHTLNHANLKEIKTAEEIQKELGGNQKKLSEVLPGYTFQTMSLPYGSPAKDLQKYVEAGEFEGIFYRNRGIMEVGWDPSVPPASRKFNPLSIHRVRASGIVPVEADLAWWLKQLKRSEQYVSDGNDKIIAVPKGKEAMLDPARFGDRQLVTWQVSN